MAATIYGGQSGLTDEERDRLRRQQEAEASTKESAQNAAEDAAQAAADTAAEAAQNQAPAMPQAAAPAVNPYGPYASAEEKAQAQGLRRTIAEHSRGVGYDVKSHGKYVPREGMSQRVADQINKSNREGDLKVGQSTFGVTDRIVVDFKTIKSPRQAAFFGLAVPEEDREKYASQYAEATGQDVSAVITQFESITGDRYFSTPKSDAGKIRTANRALGGLGLTNAAGQALDIAQATPQQIIQSLHMDPNSETHDNAWKTIQILQKTPGSAWFGMGLTKTDLAFKDSADLTKKEYDEEVAAMAEGFSFAEKPTDQNNRTYGEMLRSIQTSYGDNPRVYGYMKAALDKTYTNLNNGYMPPDEDEVLQWLDDLEREGLAGEQTDPETGKTSFKIFGGDTDAVSGATVVPAFETYKKEKDGTIDKLDAINAESEHLGGRVKVDAEGNVTYDGLIDKDIGTVTPSGGGAGTPAAANTVTIGGSEPVWLTGDSGSGGVFIQNGKVMKKSGMLASASGMPSREDLFPFEDENTQKNIDYVQAQIDAGNTTITNPFATPADKLIAADQPSVLTDQPMAYDAEMTDAQAMLAYLSGKTLDPRNEAQIERFKNTQAMDFINACMNGYVYNPESGQRYGEADFRTATMSNYKRYGGFIGGAMDSIRSDALDPETAAYGAMLLYDTVSDINAAIENVGDLILNSDMNQYDQMLRMRSDWLGRVGKVKDLLKDQVAAEAEEGLKLKEENAKIAEQYRNAIANGYGTPDMYTWLALYEEDSGAVDNIDEAILMDESRMQYFDALSASGKLLNDKNGTYWQGDSAAAIEARNLRAVDPYSECYFTLKEAVTGRAHELFYGLEEDAHMMGMTTEEYLQSAGITSAEQILDIAYADLYRTGKYVSQNPEVQEAVEKISIGWLNSGALAAESALTKTAEGLVEGAEITVDMLAHEKNKFDIAQQYETEFKFNGRWQCRRALIAYANSGALSEESKRELLYRLEHDIDIYDVAADYLSLDGIQGWLHVSANELQMNLEDIQTVVSFLPEDERKVFAALNSVFTTLSYGALAYPAAMAGGVFGAGAAAWFAAAAPNLPAIADRAEYYRYEKDASEGAAYAMAMIEFFGQTAVNHGGGVSILDDLYEGNGYVTGLYRMISKNPDKALDSIETAIRYGTGSVVGRAAEEGIEGVSEFGVQTAGEVLFEVYDSEAKAIERGEGRSMVRALGTMMSSVSSKLSDEDFGKELLTNFGSEAIMGGVFSVVGAVVRTPAALKGAGKIRRYDSIKQFTAMANGNVPMTEENIGKAYKQLQADMQDPDFRKWLDTKNAAAVEQKNVISAMMEDTGAKERHDAVTYSQTAKELNEKAASAKTAVDEAHFAYEEVAEQVANGDTDQIPAMDNLLTLWQRAETAYAEASGAAKKAMDAAQEKVREWYDLCAARGKEISAEDLQVRASHLSSKRDEIAAGIVEKANAKRDVIEPEEDDAGVSIEDMTDEELDAQIDEVTSEETEDKAPVAETTESVPEKKLVTTGQPESKQAEIEEQTVPETEQTDVEAAAAEYETTTENAPEPSTDTQPAKPFVKSVQQTEMNAEPESEEAVVVQEAEGAEAPATQKSAITETSEQQETASITESTESDKADNKKKIASSLTKQITRRFNERREAMMAAADTNDEATFDELNAQYEADAERLRKLGKDPDRIAKQYELQKRNEAITERATDIVTGTTREQREAAKVVEQNKANVDAMDVEMFIEQNYKEASEEDKAGIRETWNRIKNKTPMKIAGDIFEFASRVEKKFGVKIEFVNSLDGVRRGEITGNRIKVARDATTGDVVRSVIIHELTHKAEGSDLYKSLSKMILDMKYGGDQKAMDADINKKVADYSAYYKAQNRTDTFGEAEARQEIVADYMGDIINGNKEMIERLVRDDYTLAQKIRNIIHDVIDKFTGVKDPQIDQMKKAVRMLDRAIRAAEKTGVNDEVRYSKAGESNAEISHIKDQIRDRQDELNRLPVVASISAPDFSQMNAKKRKAWVLDGLRDTGYKVDRNGFGVIEFGEKQIDTSLEYTNSPAEVAAFLAVPKILKRGIEINRHDDHKSRGFSTVTFAGPVEINGKKGNMAVVVKRLGRNLYKTHRILMPDGSVFSYETKNAEPTPAGGAANGSHAQRISSATSILPENAQNINENPEIHEAKYSLPSQNALEAQIIAWQKEHQAEIDAAKENDGVSQFAQRTVQNVSFVPDSVKREFVTNPLLRSYAKDNNADQLERAMQRIAENGYEAETARLLAAERFDADDTVEAGAITAIALENGDMQTALDMALKYRMEGTEAAKELQSRTMFSKLSPTNLKMKIAGEMEAKLQEHIDGHQPEAEDVNREAQKADEEIRNLSGGDELEKLNTQDSFAVEYNRWGVPVNEKQKALIDRYNLNHVARPGIHYNKATRKQRMLEAILATPDPDAQSGNGLTLTQRLEWIKRGKAVVTQADLDYIADQIRQYSVMPDMDQAGRAGDLALARAYEAYGNINPASKLDKARTWRYVSMLLSLPSAERNIIGNSAMNVVNASTHDTFGVFVDVVTSLFTGKRTKALLTMAERAEGWNAFAQETVNTFKDYFSDRADTTPADQGEDRFNRNQRGRVFETQAFEDMRMMESFLMSVGDRNFWKKAYVNSLAEQARVADMNGDTLDYEKACEIAKAEANYATFNEDNTLRTWLSGARQNPVLGFVIDMIMPFTGVPTNITKRMIEYSPLGLATTFIRHIGRAATRANFDQKGFVEGLSRALSGSALYAIGFGLGQLGLINLGTSGEDDEKVYNLHAAMGEQYSPFIRVGDEYVSLAAFAPSVSPIIMGATAYDILKESDDKVAAFDNAMMSALNQIFDASYMSGLADLFDQNGTPAENLRNALVTSTISQNVPAFLTQTATALDPYVRDTKDANAIMQAVKSGIYSRIPWAREYLLDPKYDITGKPIESKEGLRNFVDPFTTTKVNDDPVLAELDRLYDETGSSNHIPTYLIKTSGKVQILAKIADDRSVNMDRGAGEHKLVLTAKERNYYNQLYSMLVFEGTGNTKYRGFGKTQTRFAGIRETIESSKYQRASDEEKAEMVSQILSNAKMLTQSQMVIDKGYAK